MSDYNVTFTVDGSMLIQASSAEDAERLAIDALQGMELYDTEDTTVDGCVVKVALEFAYDPEGTEDKCNKLDRPTRAVEFAL